MIGDKIKVIAKRPDSGFYVTNVSNTLENLQRFVGGYIEVVHFMDKVIICNEEGRLRDLPYCCTIFGYELRGPILICRAGDEEFTGLKDAEATNWLRYLKEANK